MNYLNADKAHFTISEGGVLELEYDGRKYDTVILQRSFPLSSPEEFISVRSFASHEDQQEEIAVIRHINELSENDRKIVSDELGKRYFVPRITKIKSLKDDFGQIYIDIETTAGTKKIVAPNTSSNFITLGDRLLIIDIDGNKFEVQSISSMDKKSRKYLESVL